MISLNPWKRKATKEQEIQAQPEPKAKELAPPGSIFSTDLIERKRSSIAMLSDIVKNLEKSMPQPITINEDGSVSTMDSSGGMGLKAAFNQNVQAIPNIQLSWYGSQGFIGWQTCALIAQNWLVDKAITMPARDAIRNGYELVFNDGEIDIDPKMKAAIRKSDKKYGINRQMIEYIRMGRTFGIRVAMFKVKFGNIEQQKEYYEAPFNPDAIQPDSYEGIVQVDPYWMAPILDNAAASDPTSKDFYVPTWWSINGMLVHRTHLCVFLNNEVADILKPGYLYAGVSVPQKIFERVYGAERTANEAPMLALTKRTQVLKTDTTKALANQGKFEANILAWTQLWTNYGVKVIDKDEDTQQFDSTLTGFDDVIMTQYQIVAAVAGVPATKLLGTQPKGFNSTGEYEQESYRQELESLQENDLTQFLEKHYALVMKSDLIPEFKELDGAVTDIRWNPLDAPTAQERAATNLMKAQTAQILQGGGAIDGQDIRESIITDEDSDYSGIVAETDPDNEISDDEITDILNGNEKEKDPDQDAEPDTPKEELEEEPDKTVQEVSMNGAQVTSLVDIITKVKTGELSSDSAVNVMVTAFPIDRKQAESMLDDDPSNDAISLDTMDAYDVKGHSSIGFFDSTKGEVGGMGLITSQKYLSREIMNTKKADEDYEVQVSPAFEIDGRKVRLVMDGHHSFAAALEDGRTPWFVVWTPEDDKRIEMLDKYGYEEFLKANKREGDYRNIITQEPIL